jgi:hypothetical protein
MGKIHLFGGISGWGGETLRTRFPRLIELTVDKNISVADKWRSGWGVGGSGWSWRRSLFA